MNIIIGKVKSTPFKKEINLILKPEQKTPEHPDLVCSSFSILRHV